MTIKVLHCVHSLNIDDGGPARSVPSLAGAQANGGAEIRVWSQHSPNIELAKFSQVKFVSGRLDTAVAGCWTPDVIHDHGVWLHSNHASAKLARKHQVSRFVTPRGMLEPWCLEHKRFKKRLAWALYQRRDLQQSNCLHATSESEAEQLRKLGCRQPIVLLPNGVSLPTIGGSAPSGVAQPALLDKEVIFLSRVHPKKGLVNLITAWHQCVKQGWRLRIIGPDENGHKEELRRAIAEKGLQCSVDIGEPVYSDEKWALLTNAELVVLPSFSENFGIVVAEGLAAGTPVIATTGTPWQGLSEHQCGWHVPPTVDGIASALRDAMSRSRDELKMMGMRGADWVRKDFSWADIGQRMIHAYEWQLGLRDTADCIHRVSGDQRQCAGIRQAA